MFTQKEKEDALKKKTKVCIHCRKEKSKDFFTNDYKTIDKKYPICMECKAAEHREYYKNNPDAFKENVRKWESKNTLKKSAHHAVRYAIKTGQLVRPNKCDYCKAETKLDAHHHNGYSQEHKTDVVFLCRRCHKKADKLIAELVERVVN